MPHKLFTIEEGTLTAMARDVRFLQAFPFLKGLQDTPRPGRPRSCGRCGGGASNVQRAATYQAAKRTLATLGSDAKRRLKQLLDAEQVRVVYRDATGRTIKLTF